jgi:cellulose synthase/poly-beta-1,6-N-acetylglucosamine synthase-like glycosyltransferase
MGAEARLGMLATASGTCMGHRRAIFRPIPLDSDGDVAIAPNAVLAGMRVVFEPDAVVHDDGPADLESVLRNRRRMALRALPTTATFIARLLAKGRFRVAVGLLFHKLLRWLVPFAGLVWVAAAAVLVARGDVLYAPLSLALVAGGLTAGLAAWLAGGRYRGLASSFLVAQASFALATLDAVLGRRASMWSRPPGAPQGR